MKVKKQRWRFYKKKGGGRGIGLRCKEYSPGCICCESYKFYDEHGRFPTLDEVFPIAEEASRIEQEEWLKTEEGQAWEAKRAKRRAAAGLEVKTN